MNNQKHLRFLTIQVAIATIYVIVTLLFYFMNYDLIQFRISEILLVLVYFNPFNMLGLITGTFIANLFSPHGIIDALIGTLATAISLPLMYLFRKNKIISLSFPVIMNGIIIGLLLHYTQV